MEKRTVLPDYKLIAHLKSELSKKTSNCENQSLEFYKSELENAYKPLSSLLLLVNQVEARLNMNSKNISKPSSTDEFIKRNIPNIPNKIFKIGDYI